MTRSHSIRRGVLSGITFLLLGFAVVVASKESGHMDAFASKRGVAMVFALMMVLMGNYLPKLAAPGTSASARRGERFAGWSLIMGGLAMVPAAALAPDPYAPSAAAALGLTAQLAAAVFWHLPQSERPPTGDDSRTGLRNGFGHLLLAIGWALAMFPADLMWGDASTWPLLIGYLLSSFALTAWVSIPRSLEAPPLT